MRNEALTWQQAAPLAVGLYAAALLMAYAPWRPVRWVSPFARESGTIAALYSVWQIAGSLSLHKDTGALARAQWIVRVERDWHLPSEVSVQQLILGHPLVVQFCNLYYDTAHFTLMFVFLLWLFIRHRDRYPQARTLLVLSTLFCLLVQLIPVAPPRLLPQFTDTAMVYGQSVYVAGFDQLSAMPSVHVGWAFLIGLCVVRMSPSRWRWLALAHPALTVFVVVATANHFFLDGIVACLLLALADVVRVTSARAFSCYWTRRAPTTGDRREAVPATR